MSAGLATAVASDEMTDGVGSATATGIGAAPTDATGGAVLALGSLVGVGLGSAAGTARFSLSAGFAALTRALDTAGFGPGDQCNHRLLTAPVITAAIAPPAHSTNDAASIANGQRCRERERTDRTVCGSN